LVAASGEPGKTMPPTVRTLAILASAGAPFHWSMASASARRTRTSSNGFFWWLGVRCCRSSSRCPAPRLVAQLLGQLVARRRRQAAELDGRAVALMASTRTDCLSAKMPIDAVEMRQALVIVVLVALALDRLADLVATSLNGPEPMMFFSNQCGSFSRISSCRSSCRDRRAAGRNASSRI
jgi:hypothetical protein